VVGVQKKKSTVLPASNERRKLQINLNPSCGEQLFGKQTSHVLSTTPWESHP
jgi:hypothetical protein